MSDELRGGLERLIADLEAREREAAERAKQGYATDWRVDYFYRGVIKTYQDVITDLHQFLSSGDQQAQPIPTPPVQYMPLEPYEVERLIEKAGIHARSTMLHSDGAVTAIFARLQPMTQEERITRLKNADPRVVVLDVGKLPDTGEPYIDFALTFEGV